MQQRLLVVVAVAAAGAIAEWRVAATVSVHGLCLQLDEQPLCNPSCAAHSTAQRGAILLASSVTGLNAKNTKV